MLQHMMVFFSGGEWLLVMRFWSFEVSALSLLPLSKNGTSALGLGHHDWDYGYVAIQDQQHLHLVCVG